MNLKTIVDKLYAAETNATEVKRFTASLSNFTMEQGYEVQELLLALHRQSGAKLVGWKMGMTSKPKMLQMGISAPIRGFLTDRMQIADGGEISLAERIHPKIEPEIAFILGRELSGQPSLLEALSAVSAVTCALEVIDSRYENFDFQLPDVVADNCSSSAFVLGSKLVSPRNFSMENLGITLECNGRPVQFGSSAAILGHPARSLVELVKLLDKEGASLPPGAIVLAGGATAAHPLADGDWIRASVEGLGAVECRASRSPK